MVTTELYTINGKPLIPPDGDVQMSFEDLDSAQSGRDQAGFMHRIPVRYKVGVWEFSYSRLTGEEYAYMLSVLPKAGNFIFTHPQGQTAAYLSKFSIVYHNAKTDTYKNLKFSIIEC